MLAELKGKGQHSSVRLVDLVISFCDLPTAQIEEVQTKMVAVRPLNLKDLEDAVAQVQRSNRKLEGQLLTSNEKQLIAAYQLFMEETNQKLQKIQNGISDLKAGEMSLQAIFETLEEGMKVVADAIKQAAMKAKVQRATSMTTF